jgi:hypothetical protein
MDPFDVINVFMLAVIREAFEEWLATRNLVLERVPDTPPEVFVVIPHPSAFTEIEALQQ